MKAMVNIHDDSFSHMQCVFPLLSATNRSEACCKVHLCVEAECFLRVTTTALLFLLLCNIRLQLPVLSLTWTICKVNESPFFIFESPFVTNISQ